MTSNLSIAIVSSVFLSSAALADVNISSKPTQNMSCSAGICTATAKKAILNVNDLTSMLASGDATVKTGGGAITIQVMDGFSWTSPSRLTLDANHTVGIHKPVVVAGLGALAITYNDGGSGGDLNFLDAGNVRFRHLNSGLTINGVNFTLVNDINTLASLIKGAPSGAYALAANTPGSSNSQSLIPDKFTGTFEGLGHTISEVTIEAFDLGRCLGLFAQLEEVGVIRDLKLVDASVNKHGENAKIGTMVGCNAGTISNVYADGSVFGQESALAGGLVGENSGRISNAASSVTVFGSDAGGLVGYNTGEIVSSYATGGEIGNYSGGLVGVNAGLIELSHATGTPTEGYSGGLVGFNLQPGSIDQSYATGGSSSLDCAGGLVGCSDRKVPCGTITNSYATGAAANSGLNGGLAAQYDSGSITSSYSLGKAGTGSIGYTRRFTEFVSVYWDEDTNGNQKACGHGKCAAIVGLTDAQLKSGLPAGFDPNIWGSSPSVNDGYPYLLANPPR